MEAWEWFTTFGEFFVLVYAPVILAALPLLIAAGFFVGFGMVVIDSLYHIFGGK
jgi:hypothetical protein